MKSLASQILEAEPGKYYGTVNGNYKSFTIRDSSGKIVVRCTATGILRQNAYIGYSPTFVFADGRTRSIVDQIYKKKIDAILGAVYNLIEQGWVIEDTYSKEVITKEEIEGTGWQKTMFDRL